METNSIETTSNVSIGNSGGQDLDLSAFDLPTVGSEDGDGINSPKDGDLNTQLQPGEYMIDGNKFTVDQRYIGLDPIVAVHRTMKSQADKLENNYNSIIAENTNLQKSNELVELLSSDGNALRAFAMEKFPDLFPQLDTKSQIESILAKEFGSDFQYDPSKAEDPFSDHADYLERYKELKRQFRTTETPKNLKEIIEARKLQAQKDLDAKAQLQIKFKEKHKLSDQDWDSFSDWVRKFSSNPDNYIRAWRFTIKKGTTPSNLANVNGSPAGSSVQQQLNSIFG